MQPVNTSSHPLLLRRNEACKMLGVSLSTYKVLVGKGELHEIAIGQRARRLPFSEANRYVNERLGEAERQA
jgi:excisionase family DNA binding protein